MVQYSLNSVIFYLTNKNWTQHVDYKHIIGGNKYTIEQIQIEQ